MKLQFEIDDLHSDCPICKKLERNGNRLIPKDGLLEYQHHDHSTVECLNHELIRVTNQEEQLSKIITELELVKPLKQKENNEKVKNLDSLKTQDDLKRINSKTMEMEIINKFRIRFGLVNCKRRPSARNIRQQNFRNVRT